MDIKYSDVSKEAIEWVKKNKNIIIEKFCSLKDHPPSQKPFTIFMAGSPGAGKTEFSKSLIPQLQQRDPECAIVRVDADEIRGLIPMYKGCNACELQSAASIGVEKIIDYVQKHNQNVIIDGTFASYSVSYNNVKRAILRNRDVGIFYLYQDPVLAWDFTQKREKVDGRNISKDVFIDAFFKAKENVNAIKHEFNEKIEINLIIKNFENGLEKTHFNIKNIDSYLKIDYNFKLLKDKLKNC
jgi:predicted ABC-type ATPase